MAQIEKGTIAGINGNKARVVPSAASGRPTAQITIPWHMRGQSGSLQKGTEVAFVLFEDSTGLLLGRMDGEWGAYLPGLSAGSIAAGSVTSDKGDVTASGVSLKNHRHGGVETGSGDTGAAK